MEKLNIAIADDNALMVQLLDQIVSSDEELRVVDLRSRKRGRTDRYHQRKEAGCGFDGYYHAEAGRTCGAGPRQS